MNNIFFELTILLILAGLIAVVVSFFKQPSIIAYIITGLVIGPLGYYQLRQSEVFDALAQIGITLLLFMVGLELDISQIKRLGKTALITGLGQVVITTSIGFFILKLLGFSNAVSLFIAPALTFSSTIIVVKLLTEKKDMQSLYGKIVVGIFLIQDFIAILMLISLSSTSGQTFSLYSSLPAWQNIILTIVRGLILALLVFWVSTKFFPKIMGYIGKNDELLLVFALSWALGLAAFVSQPFIGFSLEIGGFLAGIALARSAMHYEISARIKSLRDFFIILFFIVLGSQLVFKDMASMTWPAIVLSLFVLIGNPLIVLLLLALQGYKPRTGFLAGVTVAQISEFSLILVALGQKIGILSQTEVGLVTLIGILTITISSYMILYAQNIYEKLKFFLKYFDFFKGSAEKNLHTVELKDHVILVGAHRMGKHLIDSLSKQKKTFVVVDFNPEIVELLVENGTLAVCGDITDPYIQEQINLPYAKLIISTVPDLNDNLSLLDTVKRKTGLKRSRPKLIFIAQDEAEIKYLYEQNIDYVISPHFMGGLHLAKILEDGQGYKGLKKLKERHLHVLGHKVG